MPLFRESVPKFGTLSPYSIKILKPSSFRKKIKELLLNVLRSEDDYVEVSRLIKLFNTLG